jgi:hypothetical protein
MLYPSVIHKVAKDFNNAYVLLEVNTSEQVAYILQSELEYENILYVTKTGKGQKVTGGFGGSGRTNFGVVTDKRVKRIGCFTFKSLIEEKKLLIPDPDVISELSTFIEYRGSYQADDGYHDDLVMCLVLFSWATNEPFFKDLTDSNLRKALYEEQFKQIEENLTPFGIVNDGLPQKEEPVVMDDDVWFSADPAKEMEKLKTKWMENV